MSLLSTIGAGISGFLTGGPAGALVGVAGAIAGGGGTSVVARPQLPVPLPTGTPFGGSGGGGFLQGMNQQANKWLQNQGIAPSAGSCPRGYHLNKHALAATRSHGAVPARSICVRNRSMNPLNPRALKKALSREKRARKLLSRLHVFKPVHRAAPRRKR